MNTIFISLAEIGVTPLFSMGVRRSVLDEDEKSIYFGDAELAFSDRTVYRDGRKSPKLKERENWLVDVLVLLGADEDEAKADVGKLLDLEIEIAKLIRDPPEDANALESKDSLKGKHPWIKWSQLYKTLGIDLSERVFVEEPTYLEKLAELLKDTDDKTVGNFLMSSLLKYTVWLGGEFVEKHKEYIKATTDGLPPERWEMCITQATAIFPEAVSRMYVDKHFGPEAKEEMDSITNDLVDAYSEMLGENMWMSDKTKEEAKNKLTVMMKKIGYPESIMDDDRLNALSEDISSSEYLEMMVEYKKSKTKKEMEQAGQSYNRRRWVKVYPASVDAGYNVVENEIVFPAAFLQPPLYGPGYSNSMKFGAAGMVIARHMTHGFGQEGSSYDARGDLKFWWTEKDKEKYEAQTLCFVDQYGCYKWEGNSIDGELTLEENIADNGGLKMAYKAYRARVQREGIEELKLPGLDLDHNQIFFVRFAQTWCAQIRDEAKKTIVETGPYSPHPYRVYGALQNSQEFAKAFNCELGTRMNPMRKCKIW